MNLSCPVTRSLQWNAAAYAIHSQVQQSWARELIARLSLRGHERVLDVGCGDGKITAELARALPTGGVTGVDASPQMIAFAQKAFPAAAYPNLAFQVIDARQLGASELALQRFDLVFSNAALHWVDDHPAFLRGAAALLKSGGRLAVSCGGLGNAQAVFLALRPEMRAQPWREYFRQLPRPYFFHTPDAYEKWLPAAGFQIQRVELAPRDVFYQGAEEFATWLRLTWLPYVQPVPEDRREEFITAITRRYLATHPLDSAGQVRVRMVRLEIEAVRK